MANTLNRMERDGLILRKAHPTDGRAKVICLTQKARAVQKDAYAAASAVNDMALSGLTPPDERTQFVDLMQRTIRTLQAG